jgi:hypothetical protein
MVKTDEKMRVTPRRPDFTISTAIRFASSKCNR